MVEQVAAMVRPQADEKELHFDVHVGALSHGSFYGDSLRIYQILINILGNAVKFTPEGGRVYFGVTELSAPPERARYCFTIEDTGIGMPESMIAHIFEPFTRGSHVDRVEGTGLGLSITKGLIERMGGTVSVKSREGEGSQFFVEMDFDAAAKTLADGEQKSAQTSVTAAPY